MNTESFQLFLEHIWLTTVALSLWLLIGLLIAGILHIFVPDNFVKHHLGHKKGIMTVFKAVIFGVPMPLCSCGVIPAALGIKKQGAGDGASIGFLISTPQTGVDSIMVSASMLGWPFALFKLLSAFFIGIIGGGWAYFVNSANDTETIVNDNSLPTEKRRLKDLFAFAVDDLLKMIWKWLVIGILVSAAISTWLPKDFFQNYLPENIFAAMFIVLLISLPMYVCATASVPIAAALVATGMPTAAALVFLMAGPASNVATIGAVYRTFGLKKLAIYLTSIIVGSILCGFLFDSVIQQAVLHPAIKHHEDTSITANISAVIFILLILRFMLIELGDWIKRKEKEVPEQVTESLIITVTDMTCGGCAANVKKALLNLENIVDVKVDLETGQVEISGSNLNEKQINDAVKKAGFGVI